MIRKIKNIGLVCLLFALFVFSCEKVKDKSSTAESKAVLIDKKEAELLVDVTQRNLNTIAYCSIIDTVIVAPFLKQTIDTVKQEQKEIFEKLQDVAKENLISIASQPTKYVQEQEAKSITSKDSVVVFKTLATQLKEQHAVLKALLDESDDQTIKEVADITHKKIEKNLQLTLQTLERLE